MDHLPDELLHMVLLELPKGDLKAARLVCSRFSEVGACLLFKRIYFAPRKNVMEDLESVATHPVFSKSIKELVYDTRLFSSYMFHERTGDGCDGNCDLYRECRWTDREELLRWYPEKIHSGNSIEQIAKRYNDFNTQQESIFCHHEDYEVLLRGFKRLPNLTRLELIDHFVSPSSGTTKHEWYQQRTRAEFGELISPHGWGAEWSADFRDQWNFGGVTALYRALDKAHVRLTTISVSPESGCLPPQMLSVPQDFSAAFGSRITTLKLRLVWAPGSSGLYSPGEESITCCRHFLEWTPLLEHLEIAGYRNHGMISWHDYFRGISWPRLKYLELKTLYATHDDLKDFFRSHKASLRMLKMSSVCLARQASGAWDWDAMTTETGKYLTLNKVSLSILEEEVSPLDFLRGPGRIENERHRALAANIMGQRPLAITTAQDAFGRPVFCARPA